MDEAETLCDRIAVVDRGRVIALGTPRALIATLGAEHVVEFALDAGQQPPPEAALRALPGVIDVRYEDTSVLLSASAVHLAIPALLSTLDAGRQRLSLLTTHSATLEDVFVHLTGRHLRDA